MRESNKNRIYECYLCRHARLQGTGYDQPRENLFADGGFEVLPEQGAPLLFYRTQLTRSHKCRVFSSLLLLDPGRSVEAREILAKRLTAESCEEVMFIVEDYLTGELDLVCALGGKEDRRTLRLLNRELEGPGTGAAADDRTGGGGGFPGSRRIATDPVDPRR